MEMKSHVYQIGRNEKKYGVDEALDVIGRGKFQYYVFLCCGLVLMYVIAETLGVSYIIPPAKCDLELDTFRKGILTSVSFLGIALTSHVSGFLTDQLGRKKTVFYSVVLSTSFSAVAALVPEFWVMVIFRFLSGMSVSAAASGTFAYMSEFFPVKSRAAAIMFGSSAGALPSCLMPILGLFINRYKWEIPIVDSYTVYGWRLQLLAHLTPGLIALVCLRKLPESPKYLMSNNQPEECLRVLHSMYEKNTGLSLHHCPVQKLTPSPDQHVTSNSNKSLKQFCVAILHETGLLFKPPHLQLILACCFIQFGCFVVAGGFGLWFPELINRMSDSQSDSIGICEILHTPSAILNETEVLLQTRADCETVVHDEMYINNSILGVVHLVGFLALALGLNKISLKSTLSAVLFVGAVSGFAVPLVSNGTFVIAVFVLFIMTLGVCISLVNATAVDLFPTHLRGMAISMTILIGRMGTVSGANLIGFMLDLNCENTFYAMGCLALACTLFSLYLPKKDYTNNGS